jgi:acetylornithine/N-succinyldiaminopimelate aminotransferase
MRAERIGKYFKKRLNELADEYQCIRDVRGLGLMLGMELSTKRITENVVDEVRKKGFLINRTADRVLRFVPPLIIEREHIDGLIEVIDKVLKEVGR